MPGAGWVLNRELASFPLSQNALGGIPPPRLALCSRLEMRLGGTVRHFPAYCAVGRFLLEVCTLR